MKNNYYHQLFMCEPIFYKSLCFYPISFDTIINIYGEEKFNYLLFPFQINSDYLKDASGLDVPDDKIFDEVILESNELLESVCYILTLFCKCGKIAISDNGLLLYDVNGENMIFELTGENFDDVADIILTINCRSKIKIEKPPPNMSSRQKDVWEKLQAGRKRDAEKNRLHIYDIAKVCEFGGEYHIPISEIKQWTMWKLIDSYKAITAMNEYRDGLKIGIANYDLSSIQNDKYWIKRLMIR